MFFKETLCNGCHDDTIIFHHLEELVFITKISYFYLFLFETPGLHQGPYEPGDHRIFQPGLVDHVHATRVGEIYLAFIGEAISPKGPGDEGENDDPYPVKAS